MLFIPKDADECSVTGYSSPETQIAACISSHALIYGNICDSSSLDHLLRMCTQLSIHATSPFIHSNEYIFCII